MKLKEENVIVKTPEGPMEAFLVSPIEQVQSRVSAVIVIQEAFGVNHNIHEVCRRLAQAGFTAIAPELFHREGTGIEFGYDDFSKVMPTFSKLTNDGIRMDIAAAVEFLEGRLKLSSPGIAVMGFCVGGMATMIAATSLPIGMAISYYGGGMVEKRPGFALSPVIQDFSKIQCPVLLHWGEKDPSIPMNQVNAVESELKAQNKKFESVIHPGAGHAFSNDDRHANYHEAATTAAWTKSLEWLCAAP